MFFNRVYRNITNKTSILSNAKIILLKTYLKLYYILKYGNTDMFNDINIETTTLCNRRCKYCPNSIFERSLEKNEKFMPEHVFRKIINDLKCIHFTGRISPHLYGEPLLDKRIVSLMRYAHEVLPKATLEMYTNGDFLNIEIIESLYEAGVHNYAISLHGNKKERDASRKRISYFIQYFKNEQKCISIDFIDLDSKYNFSNRGGLIRVKNESRQIRCKEPTNPLVINYRGDVLLCCNDYLDKVTFGNVMTETLINIWNSNSFKSTRNRNRKNNYILDICKKCNL